MGESLNEYTVVTEFDDYSVGKSDKSGKSMSQVHNPRYIPEL